MVDTEYQQATHSSISISKKTFKYEQAYDAEDSVTVPSISNGIINNAVFIGCLLSRSILHIDQALVELTHVNL